MSKDKLDQVIRSGIEAGLLPAIASTSESSGGRPWPLVVLTAIGAWLSAIPLVFMFSLLFGRLLQHGPMSYILGFIVMVGAVAILRNKTVSLFVEQLAIPAIVVGAILLGFGLYRDLSAGNASGILALILGSVALIVPRSWLRMVLGVALAMLLAYAIEFHVTERYGHSNAGWLAWQVIVGIWLVTDAVQRHMLRRGSSLATVTAIEAMSGGIAIAALGGLGYLSSSALLSGGLSGPGAFALKGPSGPALMMQQLSVAWTLGAAAWLGIQWAKLRTWWSCAAAILIAVLAWFIPSLGAVLLVLALCVTSGRHGIACFATLSAALMIFSFYYQLHWPLETKAVVLATVGASIGALARYAMPGAASTRTKAASSPASGDITTRTFILACGALVLIVANSGIWQKELLIKKGEAVFVELAPVDPRSLMQGDFMRLAFALPKMDQASKNNEAPRVIARRDKRGVAHLLLLDENAALKPDDLVIELVRKDHRWILVTDAWFFAEGEADRWGKAKYGEFRVDRSGHALLVGLRGPNLEPL